MLYRVTIRGFYVIVVTMILSCKANNKIIMFT